MCSPSSDPEGLEHVESTGECVKSIEETIGRELSQHEKQGVWWLYDLGDFPESPMLPSGRKLSFKSWLALEKRR